MKDKLTEKDMEEIKKCSKCRVYENGVSICGDHMKKTGKIIAYKK